MISNITQLPPAVIVGLDCITGLQAARILAGYDIPIIGVAKDRSHFCCRTKVCQRIVATRSYEEELVDCLAELGPTFDQQAVLVPCTDIAVLTVSRKRADLRKWYRIAMPAEDIVEVLLDKVRFAMFAEDRDLPVPRTRMLTSEDDVEAAAKQLRFPCVVKPALKTPRWETNTSKKAIRVADANELIHVFRECIAWTDQLIVQEWLDGEETNLLTCNCYFDAASQPLAAFVSHKIRQWPPQTGTGSISKACRNEGVLRACVDLYQSVNFHGLGYIETKRDPRTGDYLIIEPNLSRPTGRAPNAEAAGVEMLYTMYCELTGRPLPEKRTQNDETAKWIYWRKDLQSAFYYWWRGELSLKEWLQSWRGPKRAAVFCWSDLGPFWADLLRNGPRLLRWLRKKNP